MKIHPHAKAWNDWQASDEGQKCLAGIAQGVYLENRLIRAFQAGIRYMEQEKDKAREGK